MTIILYTYVALHKFDGENLISCYSNFPNPSNVSICIIWYYKAVFTLIRSYVYGQVAEVFIQNKGHLKLLGYISMEKIYAFLWKIMKLGKF